MSMKRGHDIFSDNYIPSKLQLGNYLYWKYMNATADQWKHSWFYITNSWETRVYKSGLGSLGYSDITQDLS